MLKSPTCLVTDFALLLRYTELSQNGNLDEQHSAQSRSAVHYTNSKSSAEQSRGQAVDVRWLAKMEGTALTIFWHWTKYRKKEAVNVS